MFKKIKKGQIPPPYSPLSDATVTESCFVTARHQIFPTVKNNCNFLWINGTKGTLCEGLWFKQISLGIRVPWVRFPAVLLTDFQWKQQKYKKREDKINTFSSLLPSACLFYRNQPTTTSACLGVKWHRPIPPLISFPPPLQSDGTVL